MAVTPTTTNSSTVDSGYQAHAPIGTTVKRYALHNELRLIARVKVRHSPYDVIAGRAAMRPRLGAEGRNGDSSTSQSQSKSWRVEREAIAVKKSVVRGSFVDI